MSERCKKIETLRQEAIDFFLYSYLGIDNENDQEEERIRKCVERAYLDLARTLRFEEKEDQTRKYEKEKWIKEITDEIVKIRGSMNRENFDEKHKRLCEKITQYNGVLKYSFTYGQAQKWVNMTLKYMWICGIEGMDKVEGFLHIPVDSYIMEAAAGKKRKGKENENGLGIELPTNGQNKKSFYSEGKSKAWSTWEKDDYIDFQKDVRCKLKEHNLIPIKWENENWIKIAEKRKG